MIFKQIDWTHKWDPNIHDKKGPMSNTDEG